MKSNEVLGCKFFSEKECEDIIMYLENKKDFLSKEYKQNLQHSDIYDSKSQITTSSFNRYNFFLDNSQYTNRFVDCVSTILPSLKFPIGVQAWGNIYENGQGIKPHSHNGYNGYSFSANIFLGGPTTPGITYFEPDWKKTVENKIGEMHLFNCGLWHMVPQNKSKEKRYSLGITLHSYEAITSDILGGACANAKYQDFILLTN